MSIELISDIKQANGGEFPLIDSNDIKGGLYSVDTESEMNNIPIVRLKDGMLCWVKEIQEYRIYNIDSNTWIKSNLGNSSNSNGLTSSDVIDNLTTINTKAPLSANQGYQLNNSKFDDVEIIGTKLSFIANGNIRRFVQLPEQTYTLPTASATQLGGIKVGAGLSINNGILSANGGGTADSVDWSNVENKPTIPTKVSQLTNDSGFITSIPGEYITETELNSKGYATEDYVTETVNNASISGGYTHPTTHPASMITGLSTVATSGSYNDLTNKPTIPTKTSQLTNDSGYLTEHQSLDGLATESYVDTSIANIVNSAPETLDTLNELATALGNDPNFATTVSTQIGNKVDKVKGKGLSTNDLTTTLKSQYDTAYTHSQSTHFNGNYNDLNNRPTKLSQFTNDSGYLTNKDLPDEYILPNATSSSLGGVIVGDGLSVNGNGVISSNHNNDIINNLKLSYDSSTGVINLTYNNNIISSITIDISKKTYGIVNNLNNATTNNISGNIEEGSSYSAIITANTGYTISSITVTMGGADITSSAVSGNNINIPNVTGNIVITANTTATSYTITNNLTNCTTSNSSNTISYNSSYSSVISVSSGYEISSITVTMGGTDITSSAVNGNNINISNVTGNIVITVNTSVSESGRELTTTILNMQYASAHEVLPNAPIDDVWKDRPREGKGSTIPTQNCTECASGTHTASESYSAGSLWSTFGQWATIYKIKGTNLVENVGVEITDFKMWRYNENTNQWVLINDTFDYGSFYLEDFWDDGNAPLNDHKILSSDKKTYKCLMDSQTNGRCFHPFSAQKKWSDYGFTTNPSYIVVQMKARLIVWDENGADNRASANLCMNVGGDYWIRQGASFDDQWRHNGDMMVGYYKKITNDWRYVYMTTCPQTWNKGFPCDSAVDNGLTPTEPTVNPIQLTLASTMDCVKDVAFDITYSTNVEAVKHEMSWDGGSTYNEITTMVTVLDNNNYTYTHEAISDTTWNPVSRWIRVTDANGNVSTSSISITINEESSSGGTTDPIPKIVLNKISNMTVNKGQTFNILYSSNISAIKHEISWDGGNTFYDKTSEILVENTTNYKYRHDADTNYDSFDMAIRVTDANGNTDVKYFTITFKNNFTFTRYKKLDNGVLVDYTDTSQATYHSTVNFNEVTVGASYTISIDSCSYICVCYYDESQNYVSYTEANTDDWSVRQFTTTITIPSNIKYIRVCVTNSGTQVVGTLTKNLLDSTGAYVIDDFSGSSVDRSKWDYELGYVRNGELQNYTSTNTEVSNSILALKGIKDSNGNWTSSSIISKGHFAFMYGKIECRAKIDPTKGSFGAFWTLGDSFEFGYNESGSPDTLGEWWAWCGEFDVMEFYNGNLTCGTFFNENDASGRVYYNNYDFNAWHIFGMEWLEDGTLIFSIDGNEVSRTSATDNRAFHIPHFILINQAIGASGGTPADSTTAITQYVDWVKYYPASTSNVVLNSSDFSLQVTDTNDSSHNCMVRPIFNDNCINKSLTWSSSDSSLVSVHSGLCSTYAGANGTVTITATSHSGVSESITLTVTNGTIR